MFVANYALPIKSWKTNSWDMFMKYAYFLYSKKNLKVTPEPQFSINFLFWILIISKAYCLQGNCSRLKFRKSSDTFELFPKHVKTSDWNRIFFDKNILVKYSIYWTNILYHVLTKQYSRLKFWNKQRNKH